MIEPPGRPVAFERFVARLIGQPNLVLAVGAFLLGLLGDVLAGVLGNWKLWGISGNVIILAMLGASVVTVYALYGRRARRPVIEMVERRPAGKAGLVLLLSALDPRARGTPEEVDERTRQVQEAVERVVSGPESELLDADFASLLGTNLEPALRALEFHWQQSTLRECWTIGTPDERLDDGRLVRGSAWLCKVLQRWFSQLHPGHSVTFQPCHEVGPRDYVSLWQTVDEIFRQGPYRADAIICDVTGGLKLMTVGAALACLGEGRTMQYMATGRDWKGEPLPRGKMEPVLIDINPCLV